MSFFEKNTNFIVRNTRVIILSTLLSSCAMSEEVKRIDESKQAEQQRQSAMSNDLNGEQIFFRTCNECHPSGRGNLGPSLEKLDEHFPDDAKLTAFLRRGSKAGIMPPLPKDIINDAEMSALLRYLRKLNKS